MRRVVVALFALEIVAGISGTPRGLAADQPPGRAPCQAAREFVTMHGFLSDKDRGAIPQEEILRISTAVSAGCENAAQRFIATYELLERAHLLGKDRVAVASEVALGTDEQAEAFAEIFRAAYLENHLDLDLHTSIRMAKDLALSFSGRTLDAAKDFKDIVKFCVSREGLALPRVTCGDLGHRLTKYGEGIASGSMAVSARDLWAFLTSDDEGPKLIAGDALKIMEESLAKGPEGYDNFRVAYRFAMKSGTSIAERGRAVTLARTVARASLRNATQPTIAVPTVPKDGAATPRL